MYLPTICYNNDLLLKSISKEDNDEEFNSELNFCRMNIYSMYLNTRDENIMTEKNMLYTRIK